jgi:hypothetical protein
MIAYLLTSPGLYFLVGFIVILSLIVYWKREPIRRELHRWHSKEISIGPLKLERTEKKRVDRAESVAGVNFGKGSDFRGAKIRRDAGRDIHSGSASSHEGATPEGATPGVDFGEKGKFGEAEIENIAGRDLGVKE